MRYLNVYELFKEKKKKGNYLTKQDQPKDTFNEYLYDNGFGDRFYICGECDSYKLTPKAKGGMQSPDWFCDNCGEQNWSPKWLRPDEYEDYMKDNFQVGDYLIYKISNEQFYLLKFLSINKKIIKLKPLFELVDGKITQDKRRIIDNYPGIVNLKSAVIFYSKDLDIAKKRLDEILYTAIQKKYNL